MKCQVKSYQKILKLSCRPLAVTSYKAFSKNERGLELIFLLHFLHYLWVKIFLLLYSIYSLTKFYCLVTCTSWDIGQYVYCNCLLTSLPRHKFAINLIFLITPFLLHDQKVNTNNEISGEWKELLRWNKK